MLDWTLAGATNGIARRGIAAAILDDASVIATGGLDPSLFNDVKTIAPGAVTATLTNSNAFDKARRDHCIVVLRGTDTLVALGGKGGDSDPYNDAWRSTTQGASFALISSTVFSSALGRYGHGCVSTSATNVLTFGGNDRFQDYNDVRRSTDSGATWSTVDHSGCASTAMWSVRDHPSFTYMPIWGRIVVSGGHETSAIRHNDVWVSDNGGVCWTQLKADTNIATDGYHGAELVTVTFNGVEVLLLAGGVNKAKTFMDTVQQSVDGGASWSAVASGGASHWPGRTGFVLIADSVNNRVILFGGVASGVNQGDLWTASTLTLTKSPTSAPTVSPTPPSDVDAVPLISLLVLAIVVCVVVIVALITVVIICVVGSKKRSKKPAPKAEPEPAPATGIAMVRDSHVFPTLPLEEAPRFLPLTHTLLTSTTHFISHPHVCATGQTLATAKV